MTTNMAQKIAGNLIVTIEDLLDQILDEKLPESDAYPAVWMLAKVEADCLLLSEKLIEIGEDQQPPEKWRLKEHPQNDVCAFLAEGLEMLQQWQQWLGDVDQSMRHKIEAQEFDQQQIEQWLDQQLGRD